MRLDAVIETNKLIIRGFYSNSSIKVQRRNDEIFDDIKKMISLSSEIEGEVYNYAREIEVNFLNYIETLNRPGFLSYYTQNTNDPTVETENRIKLLNDETRARLNVIQELLYTYREKTTKTYDRITKFKQAP